MSKFFNSLSQHNKELSLVCCKHPLLSLRESHFAWIFKHHIPSTLSPSLSLEGLVIISTSGLEFQIVLWASSCHILLARAQFLLVQDNVRGGLTWTHWASELLTFFEPWVHETNLNALILKFLFSFCILFHCLENVKLTQVLLYILVETLWTLIR